MGGEAAVLLCLCVLPVLIRRCPARWEGACRIAHDSSCHISCRDMPAPSHGGVDSPELLAGSLLLWGHRRAPGAPCCSHSPCSSSGLGTSSGLCWAALAGDQLSVPQFLQLWSTLESVSMKDSPTWAVSILPISSGNPFVQEMCGHTFSILL